MVVGGNDGKSTSDRNTRRQLIEDLSSDALRAIGANSDSHNIADGHIWCSIVAGWTAQKIGHKINRSPDKTYGKICYPRTRTSKYPAGLAAVYGAGAAVLDTYSKKLTATTENVELLRLMGGATCPDLWHHPAVVKTCIEPNLTSANWPTTKASTIATKPQLDMIIFDWKRRGNW